MSELNTRVRMLVRSSNIQSVPVDDTLSIEGQAADAAAVGAALATKADADSVNNISVNGEEADNQGKILIDGSDIPVSGTDTRKLNVAVAAAEGRTGADIPINGETGADTIENVINASVARDATAIPMGDGSEDTVAAAVGDLQTAATTLGEAVTAIQGWDSDDIFYSGNSGDSVKDVLDDLNTGRVKSVNGVTPNTSGNVALNTVPYADDLTSEDNLQVDSPFMVRTSGGAASIQSGNAWIRRLKGNSVHTGFVAEQLGMTVENAYREESGSEISATLDRATFIGYVDESDTIVMIYSSGWKVDGSSVDPADYGVTITGTPIADDKITITYVKEERGTITPADPQSLVSTGWNLFNYSAGYARVAAYDGKYKVGGTYSTIRFAKTPGGTSSAVVVDGNGLFTVAEDGYILLTGGNNTNTYIICCWSDWEGGYPGSFAAYSESTKDLSSIMASLPNGLCSVGNVYDEINFSTKQIIQRVGRTSYSDASRAAAEASGRAYDFDEDYVYLEMTAQEIAAATSSFAADEQYTVNDHGIEFFTNTAVEVGSEIAYGASLKDKLRRDVLTISQQSLSSGQKSQVQNNIGVSDLITALRNEIMGILNGAIIYRQYNKTYSLAASGYLTLSATDFGVENIPGYVARGIIYFSSGTSMVVPVIVSAWENSNSTMMLRNVTNSAANNKNAAVHIMYVKRELVE